MRWAKLHSWFSFARGPFKRRNAKPLRRPWPGIGPRLMGPRRGGIMGTRSGSTLQSLFDPPSGAAARLGLQSPPSPPPVMTVVRPLVVVVWGPRKS